MMRRAAAVRAVLAAALLAAAAGRAAAASPSMSRDFAEMMEWLSQEMAQGLAFNAGSTFDPPREVKNRRFQPDLSFGIGKMPLDKTRLPEPKTPALKELGASKLFPDASLFPNLTTHWRMGLPGRCDMDLRFANMTTPAGYKISPTATGKGQSNSVGVGLRKHLFGGDRPLLSLGANYNYVFGGFQFKSKFNVDSVQGFTADTDVTGTIKWHVKSLGFNAVVSDTYGRFTPFVGLGYNYARGSVRSRLEALSNTPLISPIIGEGSNRPEQSQARVIMGAQFNRTWGNIFANGEVKTVGFGKGDSWIIHTGFTLPFEVGARGVYVARKRPASSRGRTDLEPARRQAARGEPRAAEAVPDLIFIE